MPKNTAHENAKAVMGLLPASLSAAETLGPIIDTLGFEEALVVALFGTAAANAEADVTVLEGAESDMSDAAAVTGAAFTQVTPANDEDVFVGRLDLVPRKRYIRLKNVGDGANAVVLGAAVILSSPKTKPVTQGNTAAFNVTS